MKQDRSRPSCNPVTAPLSRSCRSPDTGRLPQPHSNGLYSRSPTPLAGVSSPERFAASLERSAEKRLASWNPCARETRRVPQQPFISKTWRLPPLAWKMAIPRGNISSPPIAPIFALLPLRFSDAAQLPRKLRNSPIPSLPSFSGLTDGARRERFALPLFPTCRSSLKTWLARRSRSAPH